MNTKKHGKPSARQILARLEALQNPANAAGMRRFGITGGRVLGIPVPVLRKMAKQNGKNHALALELWQSGIHEARLLASMIGDPDQITSEQMDAWMKVFDSWDVCDQTCGNLFDKNEMAWTKAAEWARREKEFERRAGFALMATLAWHEKEGKEERNGKKEQEIKSTRKNKKQRNGIAMHAGNSPVSQAAMDQKFEAFFPLIIQYADDERNFVKKAVNWALRQIGKRNARLREKAIQTAHAILKAHPESKAARFVANGALGELRAKAP